MQLKNSMQWFANHVNFKERAKTTYQFFLPNTFLKSWHGVTKDWKIHEFQNRASQRGRVVKKKREREETTWVNSATI